MKKFPSYKQLLVKKIIENWKFEKFIIFLICSIFIILFNSFLCFFSYISLCEGNMYSACFIFFIRKLINMLFFIAINYDNIKDEKSLIKFFTPLIFTFIYCLDIINIIDAIQVLLGYSIIVTVYLDGGCTLQDSFQAGGKYRLLQDTITHYRIYSNDVNRDFHRDFFNAIDKLTNHANPRSALTYDEAFSIKYFGSKYGYNEYSSHVLGGFSNGKDFEHSNRPKI